MEVSFNNIVNVDLSVVFGEIFFFRKCVVLFEIILFEIVLIGIKGVKVSEILSDIGSVKCVYDLIYFNVNEVGYVNYVNVDMIVEMINLMVG